jgi:hypothetical protein
MKKHIKVFNNREKLRMSEEMSVEVYKIQKQASAILDRIPPRDLLAAETFLTHAVGMAGCFARMKAYTNGKGEKK